MRALVSPFTVSVALAAAIALAALVWMFAAHGIEAGVVLAVAIAAPVFALWNPWRRHPQPEIALRVEGEERLELTVGRRRELDVEAIVLDAVAEARRVAPSRKPASIASVAMMAGLSEHAAPSSGDYKKFDALLADYGEEVGEWLRARVEPFLEETSKLLVAEVVTGNDTKLDAVSSRIRLAFPPGFAEGELASPRSEPAAPKFPYRPSPLSAIAWERPSLFPAGGGGFDQLHDYAKLAALRVHDPADARASNGELMVTYPRQTIHHRERNLAGTQLVIEAGAEGEHTVGWTVSASNLPKPRHGSVKVIVKFENVGTSVRTIAELRSLLRSLDPLPADDED